jgi:hypothetical protein
MDRLNDAKQLAVNAANMRNPYADALYNQVGAALTAQSKATPVELLTRQAAGEQAMAAQFRQLAHQYEQQAREAEEAAASYLESAKALSGAAE